MLVCGLSALGVTSFLYKFFPYYEDNLAPQKNDMLGLALKVALFGFIAMSSILYILKPLVIRKFSENSPYWWSIFITLFHGFLHPAFPGAGGLLYSFGKGVLPSS
ncbi:MAG: hypothetical protein IPI98_08975 [Chitinophagaceae bacterium]|nr:hypothetical protein [Chitinophagaceae bacterium]